MRDCELVGRGGGSSTLGGDAGEEGIVGRLGTGLGAGLDAGLGAGLGTGPGVGVLEWCSDCSDKEEEEQSDEEESDDEPVES